MSAGLFLIVFFVVTVLLVRVISLAAKKPDPTGFKIEPKGGKPPVRHGEGEQAVRGEVLGDQDQSSSSGESPQRMLNCMYQYNGHTWDAFEVLGVPGGADLQTCRIALDKCLKESRDHDFYQMAWQALTMPKTPPK